MIAYRHSTLGIRARRGFTLIELLVIVTIVGILAISVYTPYATYGNIARVRYSSDTVRQTVDEARVFATSGYLYRNTSGTGTTNADIGILLTKGEEKITVLAYPHHAPVTVASFSGVGQSQLVKSVPLETSVRIRAMNPDMSSLLVFVEAPHGRIRLFKSSLLGSIEEITDPSVDVLLAFREASTGSLVRTLTLERTPDQPVAIAAPAPLPSPAPVTTTPPLPSLSCAPQPAYSHATFTTGTPTGIDQPWQQTSPTSACYYACESGYSGVGCEAVQVAISAGEKIGAGYWHTCAILTNGNVKCWWRNDYRQLGDGTMGNSNTPVLVSDISSAISLSAGDHHTCAIIAGGTVKCWGRNHSQQLGGGATNHSSSPVLVPGISNAVFLSAKYDNTCAILDGGTVKCWWRNGYGQLGNGTTTNSPTPVSVSGISNAVSLSVGYNNACAILAGGTVKCWGWGNSTPVLVSGISNAVSISAGQYHTCASLADSAVKCWGWNHYGQLGNGTTTHSSTPIPVSNISDIRSLSMGENHSCASLASNGTVKCWGQNNYGQLGNTTITNSWTYSSTPVSVLDISNVVSLSAGYYHTCASFAEGTVKCWGHNDYGQFGDGTTLNSAVPVSVVNLQ